MRKANGSDAARPLFANSRLLQATHAASLATLCYLPVWAALLDPAYRFYAQAPPSRAAYAAALAGLSALTLVVAGLLHLRLRGKRARRVAVRALLFLLMLSAATSVLDAVIRAFPPQLRPWSGPLFFALYAVGLICMLASPTGTLRVTEIALLVLAPFAVIILAQVFWGLIGPPPAYDVERPARAQPAGHGRWRVVWLVFDELDFREVFEVRAKSGALPHFEQLRKESFFAVNALPPAGWTDHSLPALMTGREIVAIQPLNARDARLLFADGSSGAWADQPTVFHRAQALGLNAGIAGSRLPYCRMLPEILTRCSWRSTGLGDPWQAAGFRESLWTQAWLLARAAPGLRESSRADALFSMWERRKPRAVREFLDLREHATRLISDPSLDLVLIHLPVPHPPAIFDARGGELSTAPGTGYADSLVLADRTLGELRRALEDAELADRTVLLVTSDHPFRKSFWKQKLAAELRGLDEVEDPRIPLLLKFPGEEGGSRYEAEFTTTVSAELLLGLLRGELQRSGEVADWLNQQQESTTR